MPITFSQLPITVKSTRLKDSDWTLRLRTNTLDTKVAPHWLDARDTVDGIIDNAIVGNIIAIFQMQSK
jgi:hypothetical protein